MSNFCLKKESGLTLIETTVLAGALAIIACSATAYIVFQTKQLALDKANVTGTMLRINFILILENQSAWNNTFNDPFNQTHSFGCFATGNCSGNQPGFRIMGPTANVTPSPPSIPFFDPLNNPTAGFDQGGAPCTGFDELNGNDSCPFQMQLTWTPIDAGSCPTLIEIIGKLVFHPKAAPLRNISGKWMFHLVKNVSSDVVCSGP